MSLALKYRPQQFSDVVGQKAPSVILAAMIAKNKLPPVLLFTGPSGVGKTSMARIVAAALNPGSEKDVHEGVHPFVLEIDGASNGSVEAIRTLKKDLSFISGGHRVIIIDEVHAISSNAFDALLNILEEVPSNVTFILCTTEEHNIEEAVRHRCDRYSFKKASIDDLLVRMQDIVAKEQIQISTELLEAIAHRSEGSFREALMMLEQVWVSGLTTVEQYNELHGDIDFGPSLIASCLKGPSAALDKLDKILRHTNSQEIVDRSVETLRDLIMLKGGIELRISKKSQMTRSAIARQVPIEHLVKCISIIWDLQTKLANADQIRGLEMAYCMMGEVLKREELVVAPISTEEEILSLEDLQRLTGN